MQPVTPQPIELEPDSPRVREMRWAPIQLPFPEPFGAGEWLLTSTHNVVVMLESDSGHRGFGFAFAFDEAHGLALGAAVEALRERVIGTNPWDTEGLRRSCLAHINFTGASGLSMSAVGAIDIAMWDLKGRLVAEPIYRLLGGDRRATMAYASGGPLNKPLRQLEREMRSYVDRGFAAIKMKISGNPVLAVERMQQARRWVGPQIRLMFDANQQLLSKDARRVADAAEECGAYWLEEPHASWDLARYAELRRASRVRIALGETLFGEHAFHSVVSQGAADVLMPNLHKVGGITGWLRVKALAAAEGVGLSSHIMPETSAHLMATVEPNEMLEYMPLSSGLYLSAPVPVDGQMRPGPDPGFGLEPSDAVKHSLEID